MRILQFTKFYPPVWGGIEAVTYELTEGINDAGHKCDVLCANTKLHYQKDSYNKNYHVIRAASFGRLFSTSLSPQLIFIFNKIKNDYDIIHVHFPDPLTALALYLCKPKAKIVIHWHSDIIKQKLLFKFFAPLQKWILKRADSIIGTSPKYINDSEQLKDFRNKCIAIPIGISPKNFGGGEELYSKLKNQFANKKIVFALGRQVYYKGFEFLIKAIPGLNENICVIIGGSGPEYKNYQKLIADLDLGERVFMTGEISNSDLATYFKISDLFCFPSTEPSEAFGVVQLEAMSFGKPVIATNIPCSGVSWVNADDISGYNVTPKDPISLAEKINFVLANQQIYDRLSAGALKRFNDYFRAETMINSVINLYRELLTNPEANAF